MKRLLFAVAYLMVSGQASFSAELEDVYGDDKGDVKHFIKVTESNNHQMVKFEFCTLDEQDKENKCQAIGKKGFYSKRSLQKLRESEKWDVVTSTFADIGILIGSFYTGGAIGVGVAGALDLTVAGSSATWGYFVSGGVIAGGSTIVLVNALNPYEQYKQLETLSDEVLRDETVLVDSSTETFANRLATVLDNL